MALCEHLLLDGLELPDGSRISRYVNGTEDWQIYITNSKNLLLAVKADMYFKWQNEGYLEDNDTFISVDGGRAPVYIYIAKHNQKISSVEYGPYPITLDEARNFAMTMRKTRCVQPNVPLQDAVYIEQKELFLPTYKATTVVEDKLVLGKWLSGGVNISTDSFDRLCKLLSWLNRDDVRNIIDVAGLPVASGSYLTKQDENRPINTTYQPAIMSQNGHHVLSPEARFVLSGRTVLESFFNEHIVEVIANSEKYRRFGIDFPSAVVLYGPPGCGKTFAVEQLVAFLGWPSYSISSGTVGSPYIHDTSRKISEVFDTAIENAPSVIIIDEMEAFLTDRGVGQLSGQHRVEEVAEFLRRIPEATAKQVLIFAMTNLIDAIDKAILRRGRFDHVIEVSMPSAIEVEALLTSLFVNLPIDIDVDTEKLSKSLEGHAMSDVTFVVKEAGRIAAKYGKERIDMQSMYIAFDHLPKNNNSSNKIGF